MDRDLIGTDFRNDDDDDGRSLAGSSDGRGDYWEICTLWFN